MTDSDPIARAQAKLEASRKVKAAREARKHPPSTTVGEAVGRISPSRFGRIIEALSSSDPEVRRGARFAIADDVRRNLHHHKRKELPSMPVRLPTEGMILAIFKTSGKRRSHSDRATVRLFVGWRDAVWKGEHANEATMRALYDSVATFREFELPDFAAEVLAHVAHEFDVSEVPAERSEWALTRHTRDYELLSGDLRRGSVEKSTGPKKHPEDDDGALRSDLVVPPPGTKPEDFP